MQLTLLTALGLLLVLEGLMPLLLPQAWRDTFRRIMALKDGQLRFMGLMSVLLGLVLILFSK
ncbi:MAG: hypothetical protein RL063_113 [Pseudomonadota bacterium]|jgi:uncharacterized protein YjeT (DUF2065 family)|nr:DUF2065 domain-containing protein [Methylophilales bacterium]